MTSISAVLDICLLALTWSYVLLAPYTKVEESFSLHATHDVLMYGVRPHALHSYDHRIFPGAVPRTFIGSVLLAWLANPAMLLAGTFGKVSSKSDLQIIVRLVLATINATSFCLLRRAVARRFDVSTSVLYMAITMTQFHLPFWMSRTLPNMSALFPVNIAFYFLVGRVSQSSRLSQVALRRAITLLTFTAAVFRSEIALLLGPLVLQGLISRYITFWRLLRVGVITGACSAALTVVVDSYFWQQWPLWPELHSVFFNVVEGQSANWGISPFHTYFTSHLPKLLLGALPLSMIGFLLDWRVRAILIPCLAFVLLLSTLGHKEWRFVVYVVPSFNIAAARGAAWIMNRPRWRPLRWLSRLVILGLLVCNLFVTVFLARASINNYPGGEALSTFNALYANETHVHVHISNLAAQTGASLFLHTHAPPYPPDFDGAPLNQNWIYDKTEHLTPQMLSGSKEVTHVIAESDGANFGLPIGFSSSYWAPAARIWGFDRWKINPRLRDVVRGKGKGLLQNVDVFMRPLEMVSSEKLVILERKGR